MDDGYESDGGTNSDKGVEDNIGVVEGGTAEDVLVVRKTTMVNVYDDS